ncbi:hypothetical protein SAMN04515647_0272 [Cohaesibacter sp. ES.047]|nr:hypothetical protein SAMN04515647_0272 [Cohaesibacter sp. ES.047]
MASTAKVNQDEMTGLRARRIFGKGLVAVTFSFIRTVTVGSGITPDLLTILAESKNALAGFRDRLLYRRWGLSPRPENKALTDTAKMHSVRTKKKMALFCKFCK